MRYVISAVGRSSALLVDEAPTYPPSATIALRATRSAWPTSVTSSSMVFHFALKPGGYLFLGSAEGPGGIDDLFVPLSRRRRIFRRRDAVRPRLVLPASPRPAGRGQVAAPAFPEPALATLADRHLLEHFAPAAVVVRRNGEIVRLHGAMDRYLRLPRGEVTLDLLALAKEPLKPALRVALSDATRKRRPQHQAVEMTRGRRRATLRVTVRPLRDARVREDLWLIVFEELPAPAIPARAGTAASRDVTRRLEAELRTTRKQQQQLIEELEIGNEEMKSANEQILTMNEELQSTNEELVTSKEELQSMNEEMTTVNAQLQEKVQELTAVNDDLANLLVSTDIATVFVDTDFRVKRFTTAATHLLNLLPSDVGRPITHLATNLVGVDLAHDARLVLRNAAPIEREVAAQDGRQYLVRIVPYRSTAPNRAPGVILTLVDVTTLKRTEHELRAARDELHRLNQTLEQRVIERTKWLTLLHEVIRDINDAPSWDEGLRMVLRRICESERWQAGYVYLPDRNDPTVIVPGISLLCDERMRPLHEASTHQRYTRGDNLPGRVFALGVPLWLNDPDELLSLLPMRAEAARQAGVRSAAALPVRFGRDVIAVLELFSDQPHAPNEVLENLMTDVSAEVGKVLERERATAQVADLVWREQQGLLHTLHDSLGQTLTGLGMLSSGLRQQLTRTHPATAETARRIAEQAQLALEQVRMLSRGLFPVEIEADGLLPALRELARTTETFHKIPVQVRGEIPGSIRDSRVATQLYRIAQEAVTNAVKHAQSHTIRIEINGGSGVTRLSIADDGIGIRNAESKSNGLGLRIMHYRATSIGALLSIDAGPGGGTIVGCALREPPSAMESGSINDR
jgi:signal transduction histidine kinase